MKLKEFFNNVQSKFVSNLGTNKFKLTINKESIKTPHYIMNRVLEIIENRPSLKSALDQYVMFLLNKIEITSDDEKSKVFLEEWFKQRPLIYQEIFTWAFLLEGAGTSYFEPYYRELTNGGKVLDNLFAVPDPSIIYRNLKAKDDSEYWIVEMPPEVRSVDGQLLKYWPVSYVSGSIIFRKMVWGIPKHKNELLQFRIGWSRTRHYGAGALSSAVDNDDTQSEILRNWAMIAKFRSLSKKIIGFYNDNGESVDMTELDNIKDMFDSMEEEDSLLVNKKFVSEDLTFNGNDNMMNSEMEYLQKDSGASMVPNYMTPFSQDSSYATAAEAKVPFSLKLKQAQRILEVYLNSVITNSLRKTYSWLADDLKIKLKEANLYARNEEFMNISQLYNLRAATFNELRQAAGLPTVDGGDIWGEAPPLDKISVKTDPIKVKESFKKRKKFIEKFKKEGIILRPEKEFVEHKIVIKEKKKQEKDKSFKESVSELLK